MLSCISFPIFGPALLLTPPPLPSYLSSSLNCGPQCRDPVTFPTNREINSAPPITLLATHPANEGAAWGYLLAPQPKVSTKGNTHTSHAMISMTACDNNTLFVKRHTTKTHISFTARLGADTNFFTPTTAVVLVAIGSSRHGDGSL